LIIDPFFDILIIFGYTTNSPLFFTMALLSLSSSTNLNPPPRRTSPLEHPPQAMDASAIE
ncbi:hypothetical protein, partial [Acinetobacter baumannii]|uniref:hypothetical protein n=1 Tax=Acinetobacter baumannii TaxID=470 RepID=UPI001C0802B0